MTILRRPLADVVASRADYVVVSKVKSVSRLIKLESEVLSYAAPQSCQVSQAYCISWKRKGTTIRAVTLSIRQAPNSHWVPSRLTRDPRDRRK
jgi:hypothetical protein